MTQAEELVQQTKHQLSEVESALRVHPYPTAVHAGELPVEGLLAFVGHQYHLAHSDIQSAALLVNHFGDQPVSKFFNELLEGEFAGLAGILVMADKLGLSKADLQSYEPMAEGFAYGTYVNFLASHGSAAEVLCGFLLNLPAWGYNCGRMGQGLREHYGWSKVETTFLDGFAELPSFENEAIPVIQEGLDRGESPLRIKRAARLIQAYEKMFWDAMAASVKLG